MAEDIYLRENLQRQVKAVSKLTLDSVKWAEFKIEDLFKEIKRGCRLTQENQVDGDKPYVSSTATNNGVDNFIGNKDKVRSFSNCLTIANSGSVGACFYHDYEFVASDHVTALSLAKGNKYIFMFLATILKRLEEKYSFNREINDKRIRKEKIILPVDVNGNPDWQFMEDYIKQERGVQVRKLVDYYKLKVSECDIKDLGGMEWKEFWLEDIAEIKSGVRLTKADQLHGKLPFVGSSDNNNGITGFVSNINSSLDSNVLGVNYNGSIVDSYYHPYKCIFSDDVKRLHLKEKKAQNKYCYLFLKRCILKQKSKYAYGYKFNASRMKRQKIMLPADENGEPHWEYMRQYMQKLENEKILEVLEYLRS